MDDHPAQALHAVEFRLDIAWRRSTIYVSAGFERQAVLQPALGRKWLAGGGVQPRSIHELCREGSKVLRLKGRPRSGATGVASSLGRNGE